MLIRLEKPSDIDAIRMVHLSAFDTPAEAELVELLRSRGKVVLSLVSEDEGEIQGHILFSPISIDRANPDLNPLGMAPVAVIPGKQRQGIGKSLVKNGIERCKSIGCSLIVVLGDPKYYKQFGFLPAANFDLRNEYQAGDEFMVMELNSGILENVAGMVRYSPEFNEVGA